MTYSSGGQVQAVDLNGFISTNTPNFNNIWNIGSGTSGYGQPAVNTIISGSVVSFNPWSTLISRMTSAASHQGTAITSITPVISGDKIAYLSAISSNLTSINNGRLNAAAVGTDQIVTATRTANWGSATGKPSVFSTITITFESSDASRFFFNAGGTIRLSCSRSGGSGTPQDLAWTSLCNDIGVLALPAVSSAQTIAGSSYSGLTKFGGAGSPFIYTRKGFYDIPSSPEALYAQSSSSGVYTGDYFVAYYQMISNIIYIYAEFIDVVSGINSDLVTGNLSVTATVRPPSTTHIVNSWGVVSLSVTAPD